jgi:hypothetical protein
VTPEEQAAMDAAQEKQIRELAAQITQMSKLGFDPLTIRKGIIASVNDATTPPTVSINISGDTSTLVAQVRTLNNYTPLVNQTVLVAKQGTEIFLLGSIASINPSGVALGQEASNGWQKATLTNGSHNGNGNGDVFYRRVMDHGSWKMQWRGGWSPAGATVMIDTADALDPDYRPASSRSLLVARNQTASNVAKLDFLSTGLVNLVGGTTAPTGSASIDSSDHSHGGGTGGALSGYNSQAGTDLGHSHSISTSSHNHGGTANLSITVAAPTWISLNGIEYFL